MGFGAMSDFLTGLTGYVATASLPLDFFNTEDTERHRRDFLVGACFARFNRKGHKDFAKNATGLMIGRALCVLCGFPLRPCFSLAKTQRRRVFFDRIDRKRHVHPVHSNHYPLTTIH